MTTMNMVDGVEDFSLIGDDFEATLDLLKQDEDMQDHFTASVEDVSINFVLLFFFTMIKCTNRVWLEGFAT